MRPNTMLESGRPRKQSHDNATSSSPHILTQPAGPTTFFIASESELACRASPTPIPSNELSTRTPKDTTDDVGFATPNKMSPTRGPRRDGSRRRSTIRPKSTEELRNEVLRLQSLQSQPQKHTQSRLPSTSPGGTSTTPDCTSSQEPSLPGSPKALSSRSVHKSDDDTEHDDASSQAVESEEDDETEDPNTTVHDSAPQLIMPSIRMPSRRPFTDRGKQLGKFKILVTGLKGSGKTSLIKSIVQLCDDIVHVDPLATSAAPVARSSGRNSTSTFHETYASTKPYPAWWSDLEESRVLSRRKSMGDMVLERNVCFVDSVHTKSPSFATNYIEEQLHKTINCANQASVELIHLLSGSGGSQVDLVLYLVSHAFLQDDIEQINMLSRIANVVPLISKSDLLSIDQINQVKRSFSQSLQTIPRLPIAFGSRLLTTDTVAPFTASCVNGPDYDNMDASLLMAPEYIQPLLPSELNLLVDQIFQPDICNWLRHLAAKKLTFWYNSGARLAQSTRTSSPVSTRMRSPAPSTLNSPLQASLGASGVLVPIMSHSDISLNTSNSFALARVTDHTQKEERLAHIRLSKWAGDLQLSLQREREKYENIARSERAIWLVERMSDEIRDGQLVSLATIDAEERQQDQVKPRRRQSKEKPITYQLHDPLGLLRWQDTVRVQTWLAFQIIGSFGVVGGLALVVTKAWGYETSFHQFARDWGIWQD